MPNNHSRLFKQGLLLIFFLTGFVTVASAQEIQDGSIYSRLGLGERKVFGSSQNQALGGAGISLWSLNYLNQDNPASWSHQVLTRVSVGARLNRLHVTEATDNTETLTNGALNTFQFSFPIQENKLGALLAIEPYTLVNYAVQSNGQFDSPTSTTPIPFVKNYEGTGGIYQVRTGLGYQVNEALSLGLSGSLFFGLIDEKLRTSFPDTPSLLESNVTTSSRLKGFSATTGALYSLKNLVKPEDELTLALSFSLPTQLQTYRVQTLGESLDIDTLKTKQRGDTHIPASLQGGLSYYFDKKWTVALAGLYEPWENVESDLAWPGYNPGGQSLFQDRVRVAGGVEFVPAGNSLTASWHEQVAYRLGMYYDKAYILPQPDVSLGTLALTGGVSLPTYLPGTHLDLSFEVGTRGTTDHQLVRDTFYGMTITLNVGERWFVKRKLR